MFRLKGRLLPSTARCRMGRLGQRPSFSKMKAGPGSMQRAWSLLTNFRVEHDRSRGGVYSETSDHFGKSFDLVHALVGDNAGILNRKAIVELAQNTNVLSACINVSRYSGVVSHALEIDKKSVLVACEPDDNEDNDFVRVSNFEVTQVRLRHSTHDRSGIQSIKNLPFGVNDLHVTCQRSIIRVENGTTVKVPQLLHNQQRVFVTSALFRYVAALSRLEKRLYYGWEGKWTKELDLALSELVISTNSDVVKAVQDLIDEMKCIEEMSTEVDGLQYLISHLMRIVQDAHSSRSPAAMSQLHCALSLFATFSDAQLLRVKLPNAFVIAFRAFLQEKYNASEKSALIKDLRSLITAGKSYLVDASRDQQKPPIPLNHLIRCAEACIQSDSAGRDTVVIQELYNHIYNLTQSTYANGTCSSPVLPFECIDNPEYLPECMRILSERLVSDSIQIGSATGYSLHNNNIVVSAAIIGKLLEVGIVYFSSLVGELVGHLPMERSMLILNDPANGNTGAAPTDKGRDKVVSTGVYYPNKEWVDVPSSPDSSPRATAGMNSKPIPFIIPPALFKRRKEMLRVFRNNVKQPLSLRLNTNFELAIEKLHEHHGTDCWVTPALQMVWKHMQQTNPPQLLIIELWYGEEMIAADYAHPVCGGRSVYVATRFNDRSAQYRNLMPGFMLALVATKYLQELGCCVWDLGTVNLCPLMRYKLDLTGAPLSRPVAQYELMRAHSSVGSKATSVSKAACDAKTMRNLTAGVLIDNITTAHLLS